MKYDEIDIKINLIVQKKIQMTDGEKWFTSLEKEKQLIVNRQLVFFITEAGVEKNDIADAIKNSGLKPTYTPCVLLSQEPIRIQFSKILLLPYSEYKKIFILFLNLFSIVDNRRRELHCKNNCSHWWHNIEE